MIKKKKPIIRNYNHGYAHLSVIPIRYRPLDTELMVSQLLFGESFQIIEKKNKNWIKILPNSHQPTGWVKSNQITLCDDSTFNIISKESALAIEISYPIIGEDNQKAIVFGSCLPNFDGINCKLGTQSYIYNGQISPNGGLEYSNDLFYKICKRLISSPEIMGGRTPFGIDASALVQTIFKIFSIQMPRYAHEQFLLGTIVDFVELATLSDLIFCVDKFGNINHVGIVIGDKQVLHVYGHVRIDRFDHFGIYNEDLKKYTHKLRLIKRIL